MNNLWNNISREDVIKAIDIFDSSVEKYPEPRNTFLIYNNKKYPAKHIRGIAYQVANKREISKNDYSGGQETANFLRKLGFTVEYEKRTLKPKGIPDTSATDGVIKQYTKGKPSRRLNVASQKNALQLLLQKHYGYIECEKPFDWLKTPDHYSLPEEYRKIVAVLSNYRNQKGFQKSHYQLFCDIVLNDLKLIIEYDEYQHFSKARKITLENYPENIQLNFPKEKWIEACDRINAKDNSPIDRDEKRAYYDTVKDIEAFKHGYTLIRIKHGDFDWEAKGAEKHLINLLTSTDSDDNSHLGKHKIARLIVTGKEYDRDGNPIYARLEMILEKFISKVHENQQFEFIITAGGFLTFKFPESLHYNINIPNAEEKQISLFQSEANKTIINFFNHLPKVAFNKLREIADFFTFGIDGFNPTNRQKIELVAVYDLKKEKVIRWTGKFYPTEKEKRDLVKINDLNTHFIELNNQKIVIVGCHDLNVYNSRGQAAASPEGWKKQTADRFKKLCKQFNPDIILQHPHTTDTPNIWNAAWRRVEKELPNVRHYASGIKYYNKDGVRGDLEKVLQRTKKGDVLDFQFD
jgi:very-short-patch-repair endonuclease